MYLLAVTLMARYALIPVYMSTNSIRFLFHSLTGSSRIRKLLLEPFLRGRIDRRFGLPR